MMRVSGGIGNVEKNGEGQDGICTRENVKRGEGRRLAVCRKLYLKNSRQVSMSSFRFGGPA